uniref:Uncharacterized protein n=1 Tax=Vespula pensylvanica TaxID=30213 RepID=A0A834K937_VESPE|nr:hypothetical protein H0235_015511 [Vespula pensylvanica]
MCIIIDTITAQVTEKTNNESMKTMTSHQGYKWHGRNGGHPARLQIIHGSIIPCPTGQQHDPNAMITVLQNNTKEPPKTTPSPEIIVAPTRSCPPGEQHDSLGICRKIV